MATICVHSPTGRVYETDRLPVTGVQTWRTVLELKPTSITSFWPTIPVRPGSVAVGRNHASSVNAPRPLSEIGVVTAVENPSKWTPDDWTPGTLKPTLPT